MKYDDVLRAMTPDLYERMKSAVETGRWPDGQSLTEEQRQNAMELVMVYQARRLKQSDHFTINSEGELVTRTKGDLRTELKLKSEQNIARFKVNSPEDDNSSDQEPS